MDYGVKFDILINEVAASTALSKFSKTVQIEVPKIIQNLNRIAVPLEKIAAQINIINSTKLSLNTAPASAKIKALKAEVKSLQTQLKATGNAVGGIGAGAAAGATGMRGRRGLVAPSARVPQAGVNMSKIRKSLLPNATFAGVGVPLAAMGVTAMAVGGVAYLMKESAKFEDVMQNVRNVLRSTDKDASTFMERFQLMSKHVRQVGIDTKYSSTDVAEATKYLAMAGMNMETIDKSMMPIANIATLSDAPLDRIADVVTNIMAGFKITADSMGGVSDVLASTVTRSNTNVMELAEGFKFAAGAMSLANISFHEGASALGILSNAGIKGTVAGTGMRSMIIRMIKPTKKAQETLDRLGVSFINVDKNGKQSFKTLEDIFQQFRDKKATAQDMYTIFDKIAGTPAVNLLENLEKFKELSLASQVSGGTAAYLAAEKMKTAVGLTDQIGSKLEDLGLKAYQNIEKYLIKLLSGISEFLGSSEAESIFIGFARGFRIFTETVIDFTKFIYNNWDALKWLIGGTFVFTKVNAIITTLASTFRILPGVLTPVATAAVTAGTAMGGAASSASTFASALAPLKIAAITAAFSGFLTIAGLSAYKLWTTKKEAEQLFETLDNPSTKFRTLEQAQIALSAVRDIANETTGAIMTLTDKAFEAAPAKSGWGWHIFDTATEGIAQITDWLAEVQVLPGQKANMQAISRGVRSGSRSLMESSGVYDEALKKTTGTQVTKNIENLMQDVQKVAFSGDTKAYAGVDKTLSSKIDQWKKESEKRKSFADLSTSIPLETRVGMSKEYASDMLSQYRDQYEFISSTRQMISSGLKYEAERGFMGLGVLGKGGVNSLMKPGTNVPDPEKVVRFMTDASKANVSKELIDKAVKTFGLGGALSTDIKVDKDYQTQIKTMGMEDEFSGLGGGGTSIGGGYSGTGKMKAQSNRNIIVNIENLLNIETAELLEGKEHIKDIIVQTLTDSIKDVEISYQ